MEEIKFEIDPIDRLLVNYQGKTFSNEADAYEWLREKLTAFEKQVKEEERNRIWSEIGGLSVDSPCEWAEKSKEIIFNTNKEGINI